MTLTQFKRAARLGVWAAEGLEGHSMPRYMASIPVQVFPGSDAAPKERGNEGHYETRSGKWVSKAYMRKGWSNASYVRSTHRIEVGADWDGSVPMPTPNN